MCAAVIGRQLRQQAVSGRSSGPLLQAQIPFGKNRPRAPSHASIPARPHSPIPSGGGYLTTGGNYPAFVDHNQIEPTVITFPVQAPSDRLNVTSKLTTGGAINAVVAQREQRQLANQLRKLDLQRTSKKLRCTWHCFCVAFKALSSGLVLLIVGTIMSVCGFMMENEQKEKAKLNPQSVSQDNEEQNARIRNLTYAGPVIMGLGCIVILAALVLTFEVRDTLGVKEKPKEHSGNIIVEKKQQKPNKKNLISVEKEQQLNEQNENKEIRNNESNDQDGHQEAKEIDENINTSSDQFKEQFNQSNNQLNTTSSTTNIDLPIQVCTIENELRKLSTTSSKQGTSRVKTPPDTLQLTNKLNQADNLGSKLSRQDYRHSRNKLISSANRKSRANETLPFNINRTKELKQLNSKQRSDILETSLDQSNLSTRNVLTTEHAPVIDRHLSMSFSLDSNTLTTATDHQQMYFGGLLSPQDTNLDTELSESEEPSELFSTVVNSNNSSNYPNLSTYHVQMNKPDVHGSFITSPENNLDKFTNIKKPIKQPDKSTRSSNSFMSSDLNYHFVEQQKMQQQLIAQQQILLQQQQQLTNLLQEKFHFSHHPHSSIETSTPSIKPSFEHHHQQKAISFDLSRYEPGTFESSTGQSSSSIKSMKFAPIKSPNNLSFEASSILKSTSNNDLKMMDLKKSTSLASIDLDNKLKLSTKRPLNTSSKSISVSSKTNHPRKTSSSQNLEINISDCKNQLKSGQAVTESIDK